MYCNNEHKFKVPTRIKFTTTWTTGLLFKQIHITKNEYDACPICKSTVLFDKLPEKKYKQIEHGTITCEYCGRHGSHFCDIMKMYR